MHCVHSMLLTTVIMLPLMCTVVTIFCNTYCVSVGPVTRLLNPRIYNTRHCQIVEIFAIAYLHTKLILPAGLMRLLFWGLKESGNPTMRVCCHNLINIGHCAKFISRYIEITYVILGVNKDHKYGSWFGLAWWRV